jgi:hypothetical protein
LQAEQRRAEQRHADTLAGRDREHAAGLADLQRQLDDLRHRVVDIERQVGANDLHQAPRSPSQLRRFIA